MEKPGANTVKSLSPLLKNVYPAPKKKKTKSKRFGTIQSLMSVPKDQA